MFLSLLVVLSLDVTLKTICTHETTPWNPTTFVIYWSQLLRSVLDKGREQHKGPKWTYPTHDFRLNNVYGMFINTGLTRGHSVGVQRRVLSSKSTFRPSRGKPPPSVFLRCGVLLWEEWIRHNNKMVRCGFVSHKLVYLSYPLVPILQRDPIVLTLQCVVSRCCFNSRPPRFP